MTQLERFVTESNAIEGIWRRVREEEVEAHRALLRLPSVDVRDVARFVSVIEPDAALRGTVGRNVRVGLYVPPPGGPAIRKALVELLGRMGRNRWQPTEAFSCHIDYEMLHPFTDGNGRSGRALLLWQLGGGLGQLDFLHWWYYATLHDRSVAAGAAPGDCIALADTQPLKEAP